MNPRVLHYSDIENAYDNPERIGKLTKVLDSRDVTLITGTGDNLAPGVLSMATDGKQALDLFRGVQPDFETIGNHDFDNGIKSLVEIISESPQTWLCANISGFQEEKTPSNLKSSVVLERSGFRFGVTGVTHPELGEMNPVASEIEVSDPLSAVKNELQKFESENLDYILVLAHLGSGGKESIGGKELARQVDADAVLDGHKHDRVATTVNDTFYTRPGQGGDYVAELNLGHGEVEFLDVDQSEVDQEVANSIRNRASEAGLTETVARVEKPIECNREEVRAGESRVGNLVTDAYRWATEADLSFHAPGGIRANPPLEEEITVWDVVGLVPFYDQLVVIELDSERTYRLFEYLSVDHIESFHDWYFGHLSGGSIVWNQTESELVSATVNYDALDPTDSTTYRIVTSDYYVVTNHLFPHISEDDVVETHGEQHEALVEYVRKNSIDPTLEGRIELSD